MLEMRLQNGESTTAELNIDLPGFEMEISEECA